MRESMEDKNQNLVDLAVPKDAKNIPDIKKYYWLNYCEKILIGGVLDANDLAYDGLVSDLVDNIFENDIVRLESDIQSKSTEVQKLYHFNSETGKIEDYFKPILKVCYLQDVLFQIFSITENDMQDINLEENNLENLDVKPPESFKSIMLALLNAKDKQDFRLQKLEDIISNPNKKVTIKTFDEHSDPNEQNTNFHPEEQRSLGYSKNFADCLTKIKEEIDTKRSELSDKCSNINNEIGKIYAAQKKLEMEIAECCKIIENAPGKRQALKDEFMKLYRCREALNSENNEPLPFRIKIEFKETSNNQKKLSKYDPYKPDYIVNIKYNDNENSDVNENANVNAEGENNNLNNGNGNSNIIDEVMNLDGTSLENLQQYRDNSLKIMSECKAKLNSLEYNLLMKHLRQNYSLWTYRDLKIDFPKHCNEETCKQINELVKLELDARIYCIKAERYKNKIDEIEAQVIRDRAANKLRNFEQENQEAMAQLKSEENQAQNKLDLLWCIGNKFPNVEDISDLKSIASKQYDVALAQNLIYFDDDQIKEFLSYVHQQFSNSVFHEDDLRRYCQFVKYYYDKTNKKLDQKIINNLCSGLMKLPRFQGNRNAVIKFIEDAIFIDYDIKKTRDGCIFPIKIAVYVILFNLIVIALTVAFNTISYYLFSFINLYTIDTLVFYGIGILCCAGYIAYKFFTNRKSISEYRVYKKEYKGRLDNFYNFDVQNNIGPTRKDFKQSVEKQRRGLETQMGIADKNPAEQKENQKVKQEENQNQDNDIKAVPDKMEKGNLKDLGQNK